MILTVVIVAGVFATVCAAGVAHDAVCRRRRLAAVRGWAFEHCISLAGMNRRQLRELALRYAELVDLGTDMAEYGRTIAIQQQAHQILRGFGRTPEGRIVALDLGADLARHRRERAS